MLKKSLLFHKPLFLSFAEVEECKYHITLHYLFSAVNLMLQDYYGNKGTPALINKLHQQFWVKCWRRFVTTVQWAFRVALLLSDGLTYYDCTFRKLAGRTTHEHYTPAFNQLKRTMAENHSKCLTTILQTLFPFFQSKQIHFWLCENSNIFLQNWDVFCDFQPLW